MRLHPRSAIITLVGEGIDGGSEVAARALVALKQIPVTIISSTRSKLAVSLIVPSAEMHRSVEILHREFFQRIDTTVFAECQEAGFQNLQPVSTLDGPGDPVRTGNARRFRPLAIVSQN